MSKERPFEDITPVPNIKVGHFEKEAYLEIIDRQAKQIDEFAYLITALQSRIDILEKNKRPQGEWIKYIRCIECSVCKNKFFADDEDENCQDYEPCTDLSFNYCPNCGADMRGGRE